MDNTFILDLQENNPRHNKASKFVSKIVKFFNSNNKFLKLKFKNDNLNRFYQIKNSKKFDSKENLLKSNMTCIEQCINTYHLLVQTILLKIPGNVVELGCFEGITTVLMQKTLDQYNSKKRIHVYDSFEGLPEKSKKDGNTEYTLGACRTQKEALIDNFEKFNVKPPEIHVGWFKDTLPKELPTQISFAHLDGDFYSSIIESLTYVYPKLSKGAIVVIDDYCDPEIHNVNNILPGVKKACDEFFKDKKEKVDVLIAGCESHGYFRKE